ncbi:7970_t:CDS:2, partial [Funneliformis caledonium]
YAAKKCLNNFKYLEFRDIQEIRDGASGIIYRAIHNDNIFALKSFKIDKVTPKEVVNEIKLQTVVQFHENIIKLCGITRTDGVLLWQISSGYQPFVEGNIEDELFIVVDIIRGKREKRIRGTPIKYIELYEECWKYNPNKRPDMREVVSRLESIFFYKIRKTNANKERNYPQEGLKPSLKLIEDIPFQLIDWIHRFANIQKVDKYFSMDYEKESCGEHMHAALKEMRRYIMQTIIADMVNKEYPKCEDRLGYALVPNAHFEHQRIWATTPPKIKVTFKSTEIYALE